MAIQLATLIENLAKAGKPRTQALKQLTQAPPPGAAAAIVASVTDALVESAKQRAYAESLVKALVPHCDDAAVTDRLLTLLREGDFSACDKWDLAEAIGDVLCVSSVAAVTTELLGGIGNSPTQFGLARRRLLEIPPNDAMPHIEAMWARDESGQRFVVALFGSITMSFPPKPEDILPLERHSAFLDFCARMIDDPRLHSSALQILAVAGDNRALEPLIHDLEHAEGVNCYHPLYRLAYLKNPEATAAIERFLQSGTLDAEKLKAAHRGLSQIKRQISATKTKRKPRPSLPKIKVTTTPATCASPAALHEHDDGFSLTFNAFTPSEKTFAKYAKEGGGYGWAGVIDWLLQTYSPRTHEQVELDPEGSVFVATCDTKRPLLVVAALIQQALEKPALLDVAIQNADPELME